MDIGYVALMATMGAGVGAAAGFVALLRLPAIPVAASPVAEARFLAALLHDPSLRDDIDVLTITSEHFTVAEHTELFSALSAGTTPAQDLAQLPQVLEATELGLAETDAAELAAAVNDARTLGDKHARERLDDVVVLSHLLGEHDERALAGTINAAEPTGDFETPLIRVAGQPTAARIAGSALYAAALAALAAVALSSGAWDADRFVVSAALVAFMFLVTVLAAVDVYTLYLDTRFAAWGAAGSVVGLLALATTGDVPLYWPALAGAVVLVGFMEVLRILYMKARGIDGHGLGDSLVMPLVLGLPWALAAGPSAQGLFVTVSLTAYSVMASGAVMLVYAVFTKVMSGAKIREMRAAAIPAWAAAPFIAWPIVQMIGIAP